MIENKKVGINKNILIFLMAIIPICGVSLYYHFEIMASKSFATPEKILNILEYINCGGLDENSIFVKCAKIYNYVNIFDFKTIFQWTLAINIVFNAIIAFFILRYKSLTLEELIFSLVNLFLLDVFVFNLSKEPIQLSIYILVFIISITKLSNLKKIIICSAIFLLESIYFRAYYILIAGLTVLIYFLLIKFAKSPKEKKNVFIVFILIIVAFSISMYAMKYISPQNYDQLINRRDSSEAYLGSYTETLIADVFENSNHLLYACNYITNLIRIFFPIELLFKGVKYIPFVVYQFYIIFYLIKSIKNIDKGNIVNITLILSYLFCSITFEPDFGSVIRHETVLFLFFLLMIKICNKKRRKKYEKSINN